jgi:hypothetical protein
MQDTIKPNYANTEKQLLVLHFLSSPISTCKVLSRDIEGKAQLVPRLHTKYSMKISNQT